MPKLERSISYNLLVAKLARILIKIQYAFGNKNIAIENFMNLALFCCTNYIGTYRWNSLENDLIRISRKQLKVPVAQKRKSGKKKRILHVLTEGYDIGGHVQLLVNWIKTDRLNEHDIIFTNQKVPIPDKILSIEKEFSITLTRLDIRKSHLKRACELREISINNDLIVLHHHAWDIIPLLAFANNGGPPVSVLNHADHVFWVGGSVTDMLIQIRESLGDIDIGRRQIGKFVVLPIPIFVKHNFDYLIARRELDISDEQVLLLTIASAYKFLPTKKYNYFECITGILKENPNVIAYIIGVSGDDEMVVSYKHERLFFLGNRKETSRYEAACDIYVESFPFASFTSLLQTVVRGKACQLLYNTSMLNRYFINDAFKYPADKKEWKIELLKLVNDKNYRKSRAILQSTYIKNSNQVGCGWEHRLSQYYLSMIDIEHETNIIRKSVWIKTDNEIELLEITRTGTKLAGIVSCKNIFYKFFVGFLSRLINVSFRGLIFFSRQ